MSDILDRLKKWADHKTGDVLPNGWDVPLTADLNDAIAEITYLRSVAGAVTLGENMADIKSRNDRLAASLKDKP